MQVAALSTVRLKCRARNLSLRSLECTVPKESITDCAAKHPATLGSPTESMRYLIGPVPKIPQKKSPERASRTRHLSQENGEDHERREVPSTIRHPIQARSTLNHGFGPSKTPQTRPYQRWHRCCSGIGCFDRHLPVARIRPRDRGAARLGALGLRNFPRRRRRPSTPDQGRR